MTKNKHKTNKPKKVVNKQIRKRIRKRGGRLDMSHIQDENPGLSLCWMNNEGSRISDALNDGWKPFTDDNFQNHARVVNFDNYDGTANASKKGGVIRRPVGFGREEDSLEAVLMCIPQELHDEIKQEEYDLIAAKKKALKKGANTSGDQASLEGLEHYAPKLSDGGEGYSEKFE